MVKIKDVQKLQQDIENYPITKDQTTNLSCILVRCLLVLYYSEKSKLRLSSSNTAVKKTLLKSVK